MQLQRTSSLRALGTRCFGVSRRQVPPFMAPCLAALSGQAPKPAGAPQLLRREGLDGDKACQATIVAVATTNMSTAAMSVMWISQEAAPSRGGLFGPLPRSKIAEDPVNCGCIAQSARFSQLTAFRQ
jgi:hypothetical protein